jgi:hypothetical protein
VREGKTNYVVNRDHPVVRAALECTEDRDPILTLLRFVEETVPVPLIMIDNAEHPGEQAAPFESAPSNELRQMLHQMFAALVADGFSDDEARSRLAVTEPFDRYPELIATFEPPGRC